MATIKTKTRKKLDDSEFALPEERKYPIEDAAHAKNAKARASAQVKKGKLSAAKEKEIDKKADQVLKK